MRSAFPTPRESRRLCWRNLLFQFINPKFGVITAILYTLLAWSVNVNVSIYGMPQYGDVAQVSLAAILASAHSWR